MKALIDTWVVSIIRLMLVMIKLRRLVPDSATVCLPSFLSSLNSVCLGLQIQNKADADEGVSRLQGVEKPQLFSVVNSPWEAFLEIRRADDF